MRTTVLAIALTLPLLVVDPDAQDTTISETDIGDAIAWGQESELSPYPLKSIYPRTVTPAAVVYTPAVRIAMNAMRAHKAGRTYHVADVDSETASPLVHVVIAATNVSPTAEVPTLTEAHPVRVEVVPKPDHRLLGTPHAERTVWVAHQKERIEPLLEGTKVDGAIVGAFDRQQLCRGCYVIAYRMHKDGTKTAVLMAISRIGDEVDQWR